MTNNTINNVPRELLADLLGNDHDKRIMSERHLLAMLANAPSPAGVDGLEVVAWLCEWMGDKCGGVYSRLSKTSLEGLRRSQGEDVLIVSDEPLCRLSDAQSIIDGLRGEVAQLQSMLATVSKAGIRVRTDRDQQAQRIGELEGLLLRVQVSLSLDDTEWGYSGAEKYKLLADIRAAMSAGKEPKQCT